MCWHNSGTTHTGGASPAHHNTPCRHIHEQQVAHQMPGVCITSTGSSSVWTWPRHITHHHWLSPTAAATLLWTGVGGLPWGSQMKRPPWLASLCQSPLPRAPLQPRGLSVCPCTSQTCTCACQVDAHPCGSLFWVWTSGPHQNSLSSPQSTGCVMWCVGLVHTHGRGVQPHTESAISPG